MFDCRKGQTVHPRSIGCWAVERAVDASRPDPTRDLHYAGRFRVAVVFSKSDEGKTYARGAGMEGWVLVICKLIAARENLCSEQ